MQSIDHPEILGSALPPKAADISPDGEWWLAGYRWLPTRSVAGRWRWDGRRWWPLDPTVQGIKGASLSPNGYSLSAREVAIPVRDLEAGRLPAVSVKSGVIAAASTPVIHRPRLILNRGTFWAIPAIWDWGGLVLVLLGLPAVFLLYPYARWVALLLPDQLRALGRLPVTQDEARTIQLVQKWAIASGLGAALLAIVALVGFPDSVAPLGYLALAGLLLVAIVLGAMDYYSMPVGKLTNFGGERWVILRGVHPDFSDALQAMAAASGQSASGPAHRNRLGGKWALGAVGVVVALPLALAFIAGVGGAPHSSQIELQWTAGNPCTVQLTGHDMNATAQGSEALPTCKAWLAHGGAANPDGGQVCSYSRDGLTITVRDSGGRSYGWTYCTALESWSANGGVVPDLADDSLVPTLPSDSPASPNV